MAYIDKSFISANLFNGEDVPGDNTITPQRYNAIESRVTNCINGFLQSTIDVDDTYGDLAEISLSLFRKALQNEELVLTKYQELILKTKYFTKPRWGHN